jgi:hypothetical protein
MDKKCPGVQIMKITGLLEEQKPLLPLAYRKKEVMYH